MRHIKTNGAVLAARGIAPDGRARRAIATRARIIVAMAELLRERRSLPTADQISERAGVTSRTVFMHFNDLAELFDAVLAHEFEHVAPKLPPIPGNAPFEQRLAFYVATRRRLAEHFCGLWRNANLHFGAEPSVGQRLERIRLMIRERAAAIFAQELAQLDGHAAEDALHLLLSATGIDVWYALSEGNGARSAPETCRALRKIVIGVMLGAGVHLPPEDIDELRLATASEAGDVAANAALEHVFALERSDDADEGGDVGPIRNEPVSTVVAYATSK